MSTKEYARSYYQRNKAHLSALAKVRYERNKSTILARQRAARKANPEKFRKISRENSQRYRNDPQTRQRWLTAHKERFWRATGRPQPTRPMPKFCELRGCAPGKKSLCLDHDPVTGAFRGWICSKCNRALGLLGDDRDGIESALNYLTKASAVNKVSDL